MLRELRTQYKESCGDLTGLESIEAFVELLRSSGAYPPFETICDGVNEPFCTIDGRPFLLFCANNYLSLSEHPAVKEAAKAAIDRYGIGPGGSRVISGNIDIIEDLEAAIAELTGTEACLTFPTGYMANVTVFQALLDPFFLGMPCAKGSGALFLDECNHGSVVDGSSLATATVTTFRHDDLDDLEGKLARSEQPNRLIVTEGVYSLEGEIADIPAYIEVARRNHAWLMVDDAPGIGVLGNSGGGVGEYFDCAAEIDLLMGCMDKAMGSTGGYLCGEGDHRLPAHRRSLLHPVLGHPVRHRRRGAPGDRDDPQPAGAARDGVLKGSLSAWSPARRRLYDPRAPRHPLVAAAGRRRAHRRRLRRAALRAGHPVLARTLAGGAAGCRQVPHHRHGGAHLRAARFAG